MKINKEILSILFIFLVIFTVVSLGSYHPEDPSFFLNAGGKGEAHNMFGILGAQMSGVFIGLFGLGAFWIPVLLVRLCYKLIRKSSRKDLISFFAGSMVLILSTGSLFAVGQSHYMFGESTFIAAGVFGFPIKSVLVKYSNVPGTIIILSVALLIGLILAMGLSFTDISNALARSIATAFRSKKTDDVEDADGVKNGKEALVTRSKKVEIRINRPSQSNARNKKSEEVKAVVASLVNSDVNYELPALTFLDDSEGTAIDEDSENLQLQSALLKSKLEDYGVMGDVIAVIPGPVLTTFEYEPAPGVKINKIVNLSDDLALALKAMSIRIVAPIPGKGAIGIEIPNVNRQLVCFKDIVSSEEFQNSASDLSLCLGKDIVGNSVVGHLNKMPHLLIAGATGTGKSVSLNTMICSLLYKSTPENVKMILIDPKRIELSMYDGIPHLIAPVISDAKKATYALHWAVKEMERRYELLSEKKARNIDQYNQKIEKQIKRQAKNKKGGNGRVVYEKLPFIVIIIDELADLMMVASREVELSLTRLAQMARAAGIHIIIATQRPSVDVLTGLIKANFPTRLTFQVSSKIDSRTIIDCNGAESLLGNGDMLFLPPGTAKMTRIQGAFMSEQEVARIIEFLKEQPPPTYIDSVLEAPANERGGDDEDEYDERYDDAVALVTKNRQASISMVQRHLRVGYNRAARIVEMMEKNGVVGPSDGVKPREVLVGNYEDIPS